jgi:hypothetical protein
MPISWFFRLGVFYSVMFGGLRGFGLLGWSFYLVWGGWFGIFSLEVYGVIY